MRQLIKADFKKTMYIPSYRYILIATVILSLVFGAIFLLTVEVTEGLKLSSLSSMLVIDVSFLGMDVTAIMMIIFVSLFISKEISTGAIYTNLAITPNRLKFYISKLIFLLILSVLITILVVRGLFGFDSLVMSVKQMGNLEVFNQEVLLKIIGSFLMVIFYTMISAIGTFLIQSMAGGAVISLGLMFLPGLIRMFPEFVGNTILPILPESAINSFMDITKQSSNLFLALILLISWLVVVFIISYSRFRKTDY